MSVHDTQNEDSRPEAIEAAVAAVRDGRLIVLPTDTVYGIGADAFTPEAVQALLDAKGRGRDMPPPVLIGDPAVLLALAVDVPDYVEDLADAFWPGPLTLILNAQPSLTWDLGETRGTVALRMPDDEVALELLRATGPLAVSSANRSGKSAALTVLDAATQLGDAVDVYLDGGPARIGEASTIIDTTVTPAEIVRQGALGRDEIVAKVGDIFTAPEPPAEEEDAAAEAEAADTAASDSSDDASGETAPEGESPAGAAPALALDSEDPAPAPGSDAAPADVDAAEAEAEADAADAADPAQAAASGALAGPDGPALQEDAATSDEGEVDSPAGAGPAAAGALDLPRESAADDARGAAGATAG
ncbi:L-threonylcarbamoyladenylate synthase [Brachybacterium phenoliresistens]|uniref:L-threonylcarbamoyladenylate synthase n=1 Tax=Brachybacterium phenoliresistens TaxID=396014 RepID=Z9JYF0_9MICO|nr:L-threonylcarbamoyladenylate synthase [Brachybacterium phenoliresistens]EWS83008.1 translation factor Sua5 [Brachybacterium phenoliresistens]